MRRRVLLICVPILLASCAAEPPRHSIEPPRQSWDYKALSALPTPQEWKPGSVWAFVTSSRPGKSEELRFRVTNASADTCSPGDWRKLDLVQGRLFSLGSVPPQTAYKVSGSFLQISLRSNWCDANDDIQGQLVSGTFKGEREVGGMSGSTFVGTVQGSRVQ